MDEIKKQERRDLYVHLLMWDDFYKEIVKKTPNFNFEEELMANEILKNRRKKRR